MSDIWILVADRARAQLYALDDEEGGLRHVEEFSNPEGRMKARDLQSDRPPTVHDRFGRGRHAIEPNTTPEDKAAERFAVRLRDVLAHGLARHSYRKLVLVAPPRFLGTLNGALGRKLRASVVLEVAKEMTGADDRRLLSQLPPQILKSASRPQA
jgi:protein required for attachment to host cells